MNNYLPVHEAALSDMFESGLITYLVYGHEIGDSQTPHLQGYMEIKKRKTLNGLKSTLKEINYAFHGVHLEIARDSAEINYNYCHKQDKENFVVKGTPMRSGVHKEFDEAIDMITNGSSIHEVAMQTPTAFVRSYRGLERLWFHHNNNPRDFKTEVYVYWGLTGSGKTRKVYDESKEAVYCHSGDRWFDGYNGQSNVLFDDFEGQTSGITFRKWLQLCDRYPMQVPVKGGFVNFAPKKIFFTSNVSPKEWYKEEDYAPMRRRIHLILHFDEGFIPNL